MKLTKLFKKTLLFFLLLFGVIAVSISLYSATILYQRSVTEFEDRAVSIAESLTSSGLDILLDQDAAAIQALLDTFLEHRSISYALYTSSDKEILAHTFSPEVPREVLGEIERTAQKQTTSLHSISLYGKGEYFCIGVPLFSGTGGYIHIGIDKAPVMTRIRHNIIKLQFLTGAIFLFCGLVAYFIINRVSRPLKLLTEYAKDIEQGDFNKPPPIQAKDEIGTLAHSMESMASTLNDHFANLELQVARATREMNAALQHLTAIFDNVADGLLVTDDRGVIIRHNLQILQIFGLDPDDDLTGTSAKELLGITIEELIRKNGGRHSLETNDAAASHVVECRETEFLSTTSDGRPISLELSVSSLSKDKTRNWITVVRDITRRKRAEEELRRIHENLEHTVQLRTQELSRTNESLKREVEEKIRAENQLAAEKEILSTTLRSIAEGVITIDTDGRVLMMNTVAEKLTGIDQKRAQAQPVNTVFSAYHRENNQDFDLLAETSAMGSTPAQREKDLLLVSKEGRKIEISHSLSPIIDSSGRIVGSVLVFRDITREKRAEEENIKAEKLTSLGILAGGIAHDFNNILTAIINNITMARLQMEGDTKTTRNLQQAESACKRAQKLTFQLLTFSKGGEPISSVASIGQIIEESVNFVLRGSSVTCEVSIQEGIWSVEVDRGQINQVIDNLIINSIQAMVDGGRLTVSAENCCLGEDNTMQLPPGKYVKCSVTDTGKGIPRDKLDRIFDPYFTTKEGGSGLGLATSYSILKKHKGHMEVDAAYEQGARFIFHLPAAVQENAHVPGEEENSVILGRGKVLVMDDEAGVREILRDSLSFLGYDAILTSDGQQAIAAYREMLESGRGIDLAIMDLTIPGGMGGKEAIAEILKIDPTAKVIVSSGYSQDPVMANFRQSGFSGVLVKPYTIEQLSKKIHEVISG